MGPQNGRKNTKLFSKTRKVLELGGKIVKGGGGEERGQKIWGGQGFPK